MVRGETLTDQVAASLREAIFSGRYPPGAQLPTEAELISTHNVSKNTVRSALGKLAHEGLIESVSRVGYFVRVRQLRRFHPQDEFTDRPADPPKDAFLTELEAQGRQPKQIIDVRITQPAEDIRSRLDLPDDESTVVRRKVRFLDDEPYEISDAYFPMRLVDGTEIMSPGDISRGAGRILTEKGHRQVRFRDEITSRMPTPDEAERLDLGPGTPVSVHVRTGYDAEDLPVRVLVTILPSDKHVIVYDLQR